MKRTLLGLIFVAFISGGAYLYLERGSGWTLRAAEPAGRLLATPPPVVAMDEQIMVEGVVVPVRHAELSMAASGIVAAVLVREGEAVANQQVIARLANAGQQLAVTEAEAKLRAAQAHLDGLRAGKLPQEIALAEAALVIAQANLTKLTEAPPSLETTALDLSVAKTIAEAEVRQAQAKLELQQAGARPAELVAAEAAVTEAEASLQQHALNLAATELRAPFAGIIAAIDLEVGEQVTTDAPVVQVADLSAWQIRTADLTELDVVHVQAGEQVVITFDALPDLTISGTLLHIGALGENKQGQITYTAIVQPVQFDPRLRWNMTALVSIQPRSS